MAETLNKRIRPQLAEESRATRLRRRCGAALRGDHHFIEGNRMNRENITKVRDVIAALPAHKFDMRWLARWEKRSPELQPANRSIVHACGTVACIAGWTNAIFGDPKDYEDDASTAGQRLGLKWGQGGDLFCPEGFSQGNYTQAQAVRVLDILLETGEVDWERAIREVPAP